MMLDEHLACTPNRRTHVLLFLGQQGLFIEGVVGAANFPWRVTSCGHRNKGTGQYAVDTLELAGGSPAPGAGSAPG